MICKYSMARCRKTQCTHRLPHEEMIGTCDAKFCGYGFNSKAYCRVLTKIELIMEAY